MLVQIKQYFGASEMIIGKIGTYVKSYNKKNRKFVKILF